MQIDKLILPKRNAPTPTLEGEAVWDSTADNLKIGTGSTTKTLDAAPGAWTAWTPNLTVLAGTAPTLGTAPNGAVAEGKYMTFGKMFMANCYIRFGSDGTPGSGEYNINTPFSIATPAAYVIGFGYFYDISGGDDRHAEVRLAQVVVLASTTLTLFLDTSLGGYHHVTNDNPWTWGTDKFMQLSMMGELA